MRQYFAFVLAIGLSGGASAADLPTHKGAPAAPAPAVYDWSGFYLGLNGGMAFGAVGNLPTPAPLGGVNPNFANPNGGVFGGTVGYNWQTGKIVLGAEADIDAAFTRAGSTFLSGVTSNAIRSVTTERLRLGYAADRTLFYLTGGFAAIDSGWTLANRFGYSVGQSNWRMGGALGAGVEYAFTDNITAKAEYLWLPMADRSILAQTPYTEVNRLNASLVRVGLNYKF